MKGAHQAHGNDEGRVVFRELLPVEEARARWYGAFSTRPLPPEETPIEQTLGLVAGADVVSSVDVPPFDRAVMDGFAVLASDTFRAEEGKPVRLRVVGSLRAGDPGELTVGPGRAAEIATGAVVPRGANAVAMVEYSRAEGSLVDLFRAVSPGENVFPAGADVMAGETVLRRGTLITPREIGVLAAIGRRSVPVHRRPRVAILSSGNELEAPGERLRPGKIYDINANAVAAAVREAGGEPVMKGIVPDDAQALVAALRDAHKDADLTVISGGTSAGAGDLIYRVLGGVGPPGVVVHGVAVKPGKPTVLAVAHGRPILGLPGYPTSALMIFRLFGAPLLHALAGRGAYTARSSTISAVLSETVHASGGRREFQPVGLVPGPKGGFTAFALPAESGAITTLAEADGFFEVKEGTKMVRAGSRVEVELFGESLRPADLVIAGSHCLGIDFILEGAVQRVPGLRAKVIAIGSTGGISAVARGEADIAGIHLIDPTTGAYNAWALEARKLKGKVVLVRGYARAQVLVQRAGASRRVAGLADLLDGKVSFLNRNPGSGTRALVEAKLKEAARDRGLSFEEAVGKIAGWDIEAKSHSAVATAVAAGRADAGVCVETAAVRAGLSRIPVAKESFDFAVRTASLQAAPVRAFLETLRSAEFARELPRRVPGLQAEPKTGEIVWGNQAPARRRKR
jgi:putative molybdopterin biosynthesis protein